MKRLPLLLASFLAVSASLGLPRPAEACSCVLPNAQCGAAGDFWKTTAVFVGRVQSIETRAPKSGPRFLGQRRVQIQIVEAFRGTAGQSQVTVLTGSGGGDCGYPFKVGEEYLVYASRHVESGDLTTGICSRTRKIEDATTDLEYARQAAAGIAAGGRVLGEVWLRASTLGGAPPQPDRPVAGVRVQLQNAASVLTAVSDDHGGFVVNGPAPGVYKVTAEGPAGYVAVPLRDEIDVPDAQSCVALEVTVKHDGRISGRVVDAQGRGVAAVDVHALAAVNRDKVLSEYVAATTRHDGTYELKALPPGRFVVGINLKRDSDSDRDEPRIFHPGVTEPRDAQVVRMNASEQVTLGDLRLPDSFAVAQVGGIVVDASGVPVAGAAVYLKREGVGGHILAKRETNERGEFVLAALVGRRYEVFAEYAGSDRKANVSSSAVAIEPASGMPPVRLVVRRQY